jgi:hypothetical protein
MTFGPFAGAAAARAGRRRAGRSGAERHARPRRDHRDDEHADHHRRRRQTGRRRAIVRQRTNASAKITIRRDRRRDLEHERRDRRPVERLVEDVAEDAKPPDDRHQHREQPGAAERESGRADAPITRSAMPTPRPMSAPIPP